MKKYTVYNWQVDDEGGIAVCESADYSSHKLPADKKWLIDSCRSYPSTKIGEFNTLSELTELLVNQVYIVWSNYPEYIEEEKNIAIADAVYLFETLNK